MEGTATTLFDTVQERVAQARLKVAALDISDDVRQAVLRRLNRLDSATHYDLSIASREVEAFHADLDAGDIPLYD